MLSCGLFRSCWKHRRAAGAKRGDGDKKGFDVRVRIKILKTANLEPQVALLASRGSERLNRH